ncbi:Riboflavin synthase [secondary endosymbiont of Trabutina mannipara]|uniref:Riboflavin synthase n=1 Tax=secondary endosymbiont of Trabutina mannipara TaxID=1835721 RepID=A0A1C3L468_9ENTR|nr:riboflavin synthase subunit alpha [secondary endosymbiont of Trabutina mannipara]SBT82055.1 Riboflavin synthase [secondary endosymbiont of Trabutina mannipara]
MFTGIIQATAPIIAIKEKKFFRTHYVRLPVALLPNLNIGASVAHNGCCLTVTGINGNLVSFDIMKETLRITNLGNLKVGDEINIERAAKINSEISGHLISGHIICIAELIKIIISENNLNIWFSLHDNTLIKYVMHKGYIAVDGISLTLGKVVNNCFCVHLIPETLLRTTLGKKLLGDSVNIEIDSHTQLIVNTVEQLLAKKIY